MTDSIVLERMVVGPLAANCYLVGCAKTKEAIIVDPGDEGQRVLSMIEKGGWTIKFIVDTHGHFDHTGANGALKEGTGAPLLIHRDDAILLETQQQHAASYGVLVPASPEPDRLLCDGEVLHVGELSIDVIHTPGHSPGGICLNCGKILIVGDTLFASSIGRTDLPGANYHTLIDSIKSRLLTLGDDVRVYPGHGEDTTIGEERIHNQFLNNSFV